MESTTIGYLISILALSFFGSWHCAVMCGPIAAQVSHQGSFVLYHLGRFFSYSLGGALFGFFGSKLLTSTNRYVLLIATVLFAAILIFHGLRKMGILSFRWAPAFHLEKKFFRFLFSTLKFNPGKSSFTAGVLTGLLPCGWLFTFYSAAALSASPYAGALILMTFWLGSVPSLVGVSEFMRATILRASPQKQKISGLLLILCSILALVGHLTHSGILRP